jgi:NADH-quinone oxidoreductase subunit H
MISYEVPLLLSVTGVVLLAQSLSLTDITHAQNTHWLKGLLPGWFIFLQPLGAVIFFIAVIAELERIPFDLPEAEAELVEGWKTEYGGIRFGLLMFTEWARGFAASALFVLLFLGGWQGPFIHVKYAGFNFGALIGIVWFFTKAYLVFAVMVWVRASLPRIRIDQLLKICWSVLLPLAVLNMFLAVAAFTVWQEMGLAYAIGFSMVSFIVVALFFLLKKPSESGSGEEKQEMETAMTDEDEPGVTDG